MRCEAAALEQALSYSKSRRELTCLRWQLLYAACSWLERHVRNQRFTAVTREKPGLARFFFCGELPGGLCDVRAGNERGLARWTMFLRFTQRAEARYLSL
jgi:hypothetical protein